MVAAATMVYGPRPPPPARGFQVLVSANPHAYHARLARVTIGLYGSVTDGPLSVGRSLGIAALTCGGVNRETAASSEEQRPSGRPRTTMGAGHLLRYGGATPCLFPVADRPATEPVIVAGRWMGRWCVRTFDQCAVHLASRRLAPPDGSAHARHRDTLLEHWRHGADGGISARRVAVSPVTRRSLLVGVLPNHLCRADPPHTQAPQPDGGDHLA